MKNGSGGLFPVRQIMARLFRRNIGRDLQYGSWTRIAGDASIGDRVRLGEWSEVGTRSVIGNDVVFGSWAKVGADVRIGAGTVLGTHTRIQDGVIVPEGTRFCDHDLVTKDGIIPNRTGGHVSSVYHDAVLVAGPFGRFVIPFDIEAHEDDVDRLIDDHMWGRSDVLEECRVPVLPVSEDERSSAVASILLRRKRTMFRVIPGGAVNEDEEDDPSP